MTDLLEFLHFSPHYGDWSSALVAILFGTVNIFITISFGIFGFYKWKKESSLTRRERQKAIEAEIDENFQKNIKWYFELVREIKEFDQNLLKEDYKNFDNLKKIIGDKKSTEKLTYNVYEVLNVLEIIHSFSKESIKYEKTWKKHFSFIFKKNIFKTAFLKHQNEFDEDFSNYVKSIIKDKESNRLVVINNDPDVFKRNR